MKKSDLRSGMMVEFTNYIGKRLVLLNTSEDNVTCNLTPKDCKLGGYRLYDHYSLSHNDEDLKEIGITTLGDITKIYDVYGKLIWEREKQTPEYTMEELTNKIGHTFKIIKK